MAVDVAALEWTRAGSSSSAEPGRPRGASPARAASGLLPRQRRYNNTDEKLINPCERAAIASL